MKILILSTNTGGGHNTAAKAILNQAERMGHQAIMIDHLMFASPKTSNMISNIYAKTAMHTPIVIQAGAHIADKITERDNKTGNISLIYKYMEKPAERIYKFVKDNGFDCVIATHIFAAQAMTYIMKKYNPPIKTGFVMTDYTMQQFMPETALDIYFTPHESLAQNLRSYMPDKHFISTGIPVSDKFTQKTPKAEAKKMLNLYKYENNVLIMTGSMGFGKTDDIIEALDNILPSDTGIVVLCANNTKLKKMLQNTYGTKSRLKAVGFTDKVDIYMDACDILITKPGGLSVTEAAVKEIPLILSSPIPGWEEKNVEFFSLFGLGENSSKPKELAQYTKELLEDKEKSADMLTKQRKHINKNAAYEIIQYMESIQK